MKTYAPEDFGRVILPMVHHKTDLIEDYALLDQGLESFQRLCFRPKNKPGQCVWRVNVDTSFADI